MNKKTYSAPQAEFIQIKSEGMLAALTSSLFCAII